jgi:hypothetical protein
MRKLFFSAKNTFQLYIACFGLVIGLTLLLASIQLYNKAKVYNEETELLNVNTLIVQKKVKRAAHLGFGSPNFTKREIEAFQRQEFISACSPILSNQFEVIVEIDDPIIPAFNSNIFLQSVENEFIDISSADFEWSDTSNFVPVVMPRNFLMMLNTFLSASQLPQLSESLVSNVQMNLILGPKSNRVTIPARIVGFTNAFSSILVPSSFLKAYNLKFTNTQNQVQSQLVVKAEEEQLGLLESYLEENGFESGEDQLFVSRLKGALSLVLMFVTGLAILTLLLAIIILVQYLQLMLSTLIFEIRLMLRLGHSTEVIKNKFVRYFVILFSTMAFISFVSFCFLSKAIEGKLVSSGILIGDAISMWSVAALFAVFVIFTATVNFYTRRVIQAQFHS